MKMVIVASHPIQHFCPQYRSLAAHPEVDLTVIFGDLMGVEEYHDPGFGERLSWGSQLLEGFDHVSAADRDLYSLLDDHAPHWLIIYGYSSPVARTAWRWALRHPKTRVGYIADSEQRHTRETNLRERAKRLILSILFKRVTVFLTVGDANEEYYRARGVNVERMVRMHFPIDPSIDFSSARADALRRQLGVHPEALVVLNVGKFEPRKRQEDLIVASFDVPGVHLVLAGAGAELQRCKSLAKGRQNVTFLGFVQPAELGGYYAMADVYVHPSTYDPHPLAVSEAAAAGCVTIVSAATGSWGPSDDVIPGVTGMVFDPGDVAGLGALLRELQSDRAAVESMGQAARVNSSRYQTLAHGGFLSEMLARS